MTLSLLEATLPCACPTEHGGVSKTTDQSEAGGSASSMTAPQLAFEFLRHQLLEKLRSVGRRRDFEGVRRPAAAARQRVDAEELTT